MLLRSDRPDVLDMIRELTTHGWHTERYTQERGTEAWVGTHRTETPSLLWQLEHAQPSTSGESRGSGGYGSRPVARIEALDVIHTIDREAARWVRRLGEDDPGAELAVVSRTPAPLGPACPRCQHRSCARIRRGEVVERRPIPGSATLRCVRLAGSLVPSTDGCGGNYPRGGKDEDCCPRHDLERDIARWWTSARVVTGWDSAAFRPHNTCPACATRGALRIRLVDELGYCTQCRETWTPDVIGLLADHIRWENDNPDVVQVRTTLRGLDLEQYVDILLAPLTVDDTPGMVG